MPSYAPSAAASLVERLCARPWAQTLGRLRTTRARGTIELRSPAPLKGRLESLIVYPGSMCVSVDTGTFRLRQVLSGERSWSVQNNAVLAAPPAQVQALRDNLFHNPNNLMAFVLDPAHGAQLALRSEGGRERLEIERPGGLSVVGFSDELLIESVCYPTVAPDGKPGTSRVEYLDYREWQGLPYPARVRVFRGDALASIVEHESYELDVDVDDALFTPPESLR